MRPPLVAFALLAIANSAGAQATPVTESFSVSGIHVIHRRNTANDVIAVHLFLKGGSAALTPTTAGIEQMMFSTATLGTQKYTKDQFSARSTASGAVIAGTAITDYSVLTLRAVREHWADAWDLFAQAVAHPVFPKAEIDLARAQAENTLKQRVDDPDTYLALLSDSVMFAGHPFRVDPLGTPRSIAALTRDDIANWHKRRLTKANLLIVAVGNISRAELSARITESFGALPATGGEARLVPALVPSSPSVTVVERALPTNYIQGMYIAPSRSNADFPALQVATRVLNERLFEEVRTKRNMTYAVGAGLSAGFVGRGLLYVTAVNPDTTLKVILTEVRRMQRELVPADRLKETVGVYATNFWTAQQTNTSQANLLGQFELTGGGWRNAETSIERLRGVTPADIQRVSVRYLKNAKFVVVGDPKKIDRTLFMSM